MSERSHNVLINANNLNYIESPKPLCIKGFGRFGLPIQVMERRINAKTTEKLSKLEGIKGTNAHFVELILQRGRLVE